MRKNLIALFLLYALQFLATACSPPCDCDDASIFEKSYTGVLMNTYNTSGFRNILAENNIPKNGFGLEIYFEFDEKQIAKQSSNFNLSGFGFNSSLACSCVPPEYLVTDPIIGIEILVTDTLMNTTNDISDNFTFYEYYEDKNIPFLSFFQNRELWRDGFQLDLAVLDNIPDNSIFTVNLTLESGTIISKSTNMITFI